MEVIVALSIFSIGLIGMASLMLQSMQAEALNEGYLKASLFAQEGVELVRGIRDENWLNPSLVAWDLNIYDPADTTFTIDYNNNIDRSVDFITDAGAVLRLNGGDFYEHAAGQATTYSRLMDVTSCGPDCREVKATVSWKHSGKVSTYEATTILYDWR